MGYLGICLVSSFIFRLKEGGWLVIKRKVVGEVIKIFVIFGLYYIVIMVVSLLGFIYFFLW